MTVESLELSGIDGTNPLGFLSALGALVAARQAGEKGACLRWTRTSTWVPVLDRISSTCNPVDISARIAGALRGRAVSESDEERRATTQREFEAAKQAVGKKEKDIRGRGLSRKDREAATEQEVYPLKEASEEKRQRWLDALKKAVPSPELALGKRIDCTPEEYRELTDMFLRGSEHIGRETLDLLAAFGSDACKEQRVPAIRPTPFCFIKGGGHQFFLDTVRQLMEQVTPERVKQALFESWVYRDEKLSMRWDPSEDRRYALMDRDPTASDNKSRTVWMANLLGYRALVLFPCAPTGAGLGTTAWSDAGTENPVLTWPVWEFPLPPDTIRSLLQLSEFAKPQPDRAALRALGIADAFRAHRIRFPPTGSNYKTNFSPARAV